VWVKAGYGETEEEFLEYLQGKISFDLFKKLYPEYSHITEDEYKQILVDGMWGEM
jgi:hypothetical protein